MQLAGLSFLFFVFHLFRFACTFAGSVKSFFSLLFADVIFDAGWTRAVLILGVFVFCVTEDEQTFSHSQVSGMTE